MTHEGSDGLVVAAEGRRGGFTLAVSLTAAPGQVLGLLGPNGAGKSTLLSAVAGLTPVSAGRITLASAVFDDADQGTFVEGAGRPRRGEQGGEVGRQLLARPAQADRPG